MAANTIITSILQAGSNNHYTTSEEANFMATDFVVEGVIGSISLNTGSGGTGSFCVNADSVPDMGIAILAGGAYIDATPAGQDAQVLRARASADYTNYTINANSSGTTKYDWIYLSVDATNANNPDSAGDDVTSIVTSRSSSNTSDTGSPPTYAILLAIIEVVNGTTSITNSNITDKRINAALSIPVGTINVTSLHNPSNFSVYRSTSLPTLLGSNVASKIPFDSVVWDTGSDYDATNYRFVAPADGFYQFNTGITFDNGVHTDSFIIYFYVNGGTTKQGMNMSGSSSGGVSTFTSSGDFYLHASDYLEIWMYSGVSATSIGVEGGSALTYFSGHLISPT